MSYIEDVDTALKEMPGHLADAVRLVYMDGHTLRSAAKLLKIDHKTVGARAKKGLDMLRAKGIDGALPTTRTRAEEHLRSKLVEDENGCWVYTGGRRGKNYGNYWMEGENRYAHRAAYDLFVGPIPEDGFIHHKCSNRLCCNPEHLQCTTWDANLAEMLSRQSLIRKIRKLEAELAELKGES